MPNDTNSPTEDSYVCDCPFCNPGGGGEVHRVIIPPANIRGFLCEECDAFWLQER